MGLEVFLINLYFSTVVSQYKFLRDEVSKGHLHISCLFAIVFAFQIIFRNFSTICCRIFKLNLPDLVLSFDNYIPPAWFKPRSCIEYPPPTLWYCTWFLQSDWILQNIHKMFKYSILTEWMKSVQSDFLYGLATNLAWLQHITQFTHSAIPLGCMFQN